MISPADLIKLQAAILFRYDPAGRMLCTNEADATPAPRLFLGRTTAGNVWRFRYDLPDSLIRDLERLLRAEPVATDLTLPPETLPDVADALNAHAPIQQISMGPAWRFPGTLAPPQEVTLVSGSNVGALRNHFPWAVTEWKDVQPCLAAIVDGDAVSLCFSSRTSINAAEAGVETAPAFWGRGYATAVVAAWGRAIRASNRIPLYSTSWENLASRNVARKLGLVLYGADLSIT